MSYETIDGLKQILKSSFENAEQGISKLPHEVANLNGMSSPKIRRFLNNLCSHGLCNYLEVGTWSGSTLVPALFQNDCHGVAIDNFSQFQEQNPRQQLTQNLLKYGPELKTYEIIEADCFGMEREVLSRLPKFNVFLYDGNHGKVETECAINVFGGICADPFILVVDDIELTPSVWEGTQAALNHYTIHSSIEGHKRDAYHMGIFAAVVERVKL